MFLDEGHYLPLHITAVQNAVQTSMIAAKACTVAVAIQKVTKVTTHHAIVSAANTEPMNNVRMVAVMLRSKR